jgi:hypothetical protein
MLDIILLVAGAGSLGATLGYVLGLITKKFTSPTVQQLSRALAENDAWYKTQIGRLKSRLKEYEQPSELQQFAHKYAEEAQNPENLVQLLSNELGNIRGLPRWLRPFIPAITSYIRENPEQVQMLIQKFLSPNRGPQQQSETYL